MCSSLCCWTQAISVYNKVPLQIRILKHFSLSFLNTSWTIWEKKYERYHLSLLMVKCFHVFLLSLSKTVVFRAVDVVVILRFEDAKFDNKNQNESIVILHALLWGTKTIKDRVMVENIKAKTHCNCRLCSGAGMYFKYLNRPFKSKLKQLCGQVGLRWSLLLTERLHLPWDRIDFDSLFYWIDSFPLLPLQKLPVNHYDKVLLRVHSDGDKSQSHLNGTFQWVIVEVGTLRAGQLREDPYLWMWATLLTLILTSKLTIRVLALYWRADFQTPQNSPVHLEINCSVLCVIMYLFFSKKRKPWSALFKWLLYLCQKSRVWGSLRGVIEWLKILTSTERALSVCHFWCASFLVWCDCCCIVSAAHKVKKTKNLINCKQMSAAIIMQKCK